MSGNPPQIGYLRSLANFKPNARLYLGGSFISSLVTGAFGTLLNLYVTALGYREDFVGVLLMLQLLSTCCGAIPAALICDRIGRRKSLIAAATAIGVGTLGMAWSSNRPMLMMFAIIYGFASAFTAVTVSPFLMENSSDSERPHLFGISFAAQTIAMMFGNFISGFMTDGFTHPLGKVMAFRVTLSVFAVLTCGAGFCYSAIAEKRPDGQGRTFREVVGAMGRALKLPQTVNLVIYNALIGLGAGMVVPFFNLFLSHKLGMPPRGVGTVIASSQIVTAIACLATPLLVSRFGKINSVTGSQLLSIPFLLMIALPPYVGVVVFAFLARNSLMNMSNPIISNLSMEVVPAESRSAVSSFVRMANDGMRSLSAVAAGFLMKNVSYEAPYFITCVVYIAASIHYYRSFAKYDTPAKRNTFERTA